MHYMCPTKYAFCLILTKKEKSSLRGKVSEIYVNNSKGTDVAWKAIHKQKTTHVCSSFASQLLWFFALL